MGSGRRRPRETPHGQPGVNNEKNSRRLISHPLGAQPFKLMRFRSHAHPRGPASGRLGAAWIVAKVIRKLERGERGSKFPTLKRGPK